MTTAATISSPQPRPHLCTGHEREITSRLRTVGGQLGGVHAMYDNGRYRIDVLDQLPAVAAAADAIARLILEDHLLACVREEINGADTDQQVDEPATAVRRHVRGRGGRR